MSKAGGNRAAGSRQRFHSGGPWQKLAVDLVGPMPQIIKVNHWILVITDYFSPWQKALPIPEASAPVVASVLDERVFCYQIKQTRG